LELNSGKRYNAPRSDAFSARSLVFHSEASMKRSTLIWGTVLMAASFSLRDAAAADLPAANQVKIEELFEVSGYCEGVVFDHAGNGYVSYKDTIEQFKLDGSHQPWAVTGAPNGHKVLADGTHLVCDASRHAVLRLDASGKLLDPASAECGGKPLRGPNDLTLDPRGGFYFTDPGGSSDVTPIGTVHYVDPAGKTHLIAENLAFPNGIVLVPGGKKLLVAESKKNRVLAYDIITPGQLGPLTVFAELPSKEGEQIDNQPDGMCLDAQGNLYVAHYGMRQVQVLDPQGKLIRRYPGGNLTTSNVAFGGPKMEHLFITGGLGAEAGGGGLFRIDLGAKGLVILPAKAAP
jgi:gluconolactonase